MSERDIDISPFEKWLEENVDHIPIVRWGDLHSRIAMMFARDYAAGATRRLLDEALNSGDGSYKP